MCHFWKELSVVGTARASCARGGPERQRVPERGSVGETRGGGTEAGMAAWQSGSGTRTFGSGALPRAVTQSGRRAPTHGGSVWFQTGQTCLERASVPGVRFPTPGDRMSYLAGICLRGLDPKTKHKLAKANSAPESDPRVARIVRRSGQNFKVWCLSES